MPNDNRIRTETELAGYARALQEFTEVLNQFGFGWFLSCGALLGAYRDGDLIPWDWDIDLEGKQEEVVPYMDQVVKKLKEAGFDARRGKKNRRIIGKKYGCLCVIRLWHLKGKYRVLKKQRIPLKLFNNEGTIELRGNIYPCPKDVEAYLEWMYGTWKIPVRDNTVRNYVTNKFRKKGKVKC